MRQTAIDGRYAPIELLGGGGLAEVYLAHDQVLDRDVALKVLRDRYARDEEFVDRYSTEAKSAARLSHPNIASIFDQGRSEDGAYYVAMEYAPWGTLKDRLRRDGALSPEVAAGVALQIAYALSAAHKQRVVHRDVKPQNVLATRRGDLKGAGDVKVTDFGIAGAASSSSVTAPVAILDSAAYMPPEQAKGEPVGPQSDLYSLGVVLYETLTGELPYAAEDPVALANMHASEPPRSPREANPAVPEALDAVTLRLLSKSPEGRYASADELAEALERARPALPPAVTADTGTPEGRRGGTLLPRKALPAAAAVLTALALLLGGLSWALAPEDGQGGQRPDASARRGQQPEAENVGVNKLWQEFNGEIKGERPVPGVVLEGGDANDTLRGSDDRDALRGQEGDDEISGLGGDDKIGGGGGADTLYGGPGSDALWGWEGDDAFDDGDDGEEDTIVCGGGFDTATVGDEDTVMGCEDVTTR